MNKFIYLLAIIIALPSFALALEDTHGVLIDRGITRSKTGSEPPKPADATQPETAKDKSKDDENQTDNNSNTNPRPLADVPRNYKKIANNVGVKAQNYYRAKHSGSVNTEVKD